MDSIINGIMQIIGSLGFPIAMCIYMVWVNQNKDKEHAEEVKRLSDAITDLRTVMQRILDKLEG